MEPTPKPVGVSNVKKKGETGAARKGGNRGSTTVTTHNIKKRGKPLPNTSAQKKEEKKARTEGCVARG